MKKRLFLKKVKSMKYDELEELWYETQSNKKLDIIEKYLVKKSTYEHSEWSGIEIEF